jgi:3-deoxy-7-phosphoheptulonate synthase
MIIVIKKNVKLELLNELISDIEKEGIKVTKIENPTYDLLNLTGDVTSLDEKKIGAYDFVNQVIRISPSYEKVNRKSQNVPTSIDVNGIKVGGNEKIVIIAGPCSVESEEQLTRIALSVKESGACMLRGGAYKPRTSPYSFQGLKSEGIEYLSRVKDKVYMPVVSEITSIESIDEFVKNVDIIQVGTRNMQNYELLKALGKVNKPILLKRGFASTIEEWLMSAEYIINGGNDQVILCERGIRSFEPMTRFSLDLSVIPLVKKLSHLPIIVDPSHASGNWELVESLSLASIAAGADGLLIEVHDNPKCALSDGMQSLKLKNFEQLVKKARKVAESIGREIR